MAHWKQIGFDLIANDIQEQSSLIISINHSGCNLFRFIYPWSHTVCKTINNQINRTFLESRG